MHSGLSSYKHVFSDAEAHNVGKNARVEWEHELAKRAREGDDSRFHNLPPSVLEQRLAEVAKRDRFTVVSVTFLHPRQLAPLVVVRTTHYVALARATPAILGRIDPKRNNGPDTTGWAYEGFYFEAQDERGIPFLITQNFMRGRGPGGGQWARSDGLFPFDRL